MPFTMRRKNIWLAEFTNVWLSLHFDNPEVGGAYASEIFGGSYIRMKLALSSAEDGVVFNIDGVKFTGLPQTAITHFGGWNALRSGDLEFSGPLNADGSVIRLAAGQSYTVLPQAIALSIQ